MRYSSDESGKLSDEELLSVLTKLQDQDITVAGEAAETLYVLTSLPSAVKIDCKSAYTEYDKMVFGACTDFPEGSEARQETDWIDGRKYKMGDGFMMMEDVVAEDPEGQPDQCADPRAVSKCSDKDEIGHAGPVRVRRVAVHHSKDCIEYRSRIGQVAETFPGLVRLLGCGDASVRLSACRAMSQICFRHQTNKTATAACPGFWLALSATLEEAEARRDHRLLTEACRLLGGLASGHPDNQGMVAGDERLMEVLRRLWQAGGAGGEASGQIGKALNAVAHLVDL
eukprot:CAMPEP_0113662382 /NCGR_PEP_ID=MMETSP0038_2-20120614/537_1 /TAXON_ID=2898 /ORGANISM="Cryptomonas paramecium" /LENGTH=283 /DNA_ID=CAMNT_0000577255 /DNA_START=65 /DNA_END=916 /DNA_ORIENTATION=- /assembly_acc=CAM_ASM_000170